MGLRVVLALALLALAPLAAAQVPRVPSLPVSPTVLGPLVNSAWDRASPTVETETQEDLQNEEIEIVLDLVIRNAEFGVVGVLFGGGKIEMDVEARLSFAFRAVSAERIDAAMKRATGDSNVSLSGTFGMNSSKMVVTAEEVRVLGGGVVLQAFRSYQEEATEILIERALPGSRVLSSRFAWSNIVPFSNLRESDIGSPVEGRPVDLRDPPLLLDATMRLNFLDRKSLGDLIEGYQQAPSEEPAVPRPKSLKERIEENQTLPPLERNAFTVVGIGQLLALNVPPGWRLNLTIEVPKGYTIEDATDELLVAEDHRSATYYVDGSARSTVLETAGVVTISNRFLVTAVLAGAAVFVGTIARFGVEATVFTGRRLYAKLWKRLTS